MKQLKEFREVELNTREIWNKVQLQIRLKILYSDYKLNSLLQSKYYQLLNELNSLMEIIQTLPFFSAAPFICSTDMH